MKKLLALLLCGLLLTGCASNSNTPTQGASTDPVPESTLAPIGKVEETAEIPYVSRFDSVTAIVLSDSGITVDGGGETDTVFTSHDIIYYEDKDTYESGYPYGEGTDADKHSADEAAAHTVVNITAPGAYRVSGKLSAGQIRIDLGEDSNEDPDAVVELILENADITCTVAPAILFQNVYECDGMWSTDTAKAEVDTTTAGANLVLEGENTVSGAYVARIYKDKEGEKKLWKQDGAIYSYMSMNVYGPGSLDLAAANEGLDTELHLTINGGSISICSDNDGINTNEDGVSVTTINAGTLHIIAGLGEEGDGIDSNGYLVINGGTVVASANPAADAGLDSDMGSYINGGTVIALGSTMDWAESDSDQVTMNLQFASQQSSGSAIVVTREDGAVLFAYDPSEDEVLGENVRQYMGAIVSCPYFTQGERCYVYLDGAVAGSEVGGVYDITTVTGFEGGVRQAYTGTDVTMMPGRGGLGGMGGQRPEGEMPEGFTPGEPPEGFGGEMPTLPEGETIPEGFGPGQGGEMPTLPEGETRPADFTPGDVPDGGFGGRGQGGRDFGQAAGEGNTVFYFQDKVNCFSGIAAAE